MLGERSITSGSEQLAFIDKVFAGVLSILRLEPRLKALLAAFSKAFYTDATAKANYTPSSIS